MNFTDKVQVLEVSFSGGVNELTMIPEYDVDAICLPLTKVLRQVSAYPRPQERGDAADWREMVLVDVVENLVVKGE